MAKTAKKNHKLPKHMQVEKRLVYDNNCWTCQWWNHSLNFFAPQWGKRLESLWHLRHGQWYDRHCTGAHTNLGASRDLWDFIPPTPRKVYIGSTSPSHTPVEGIMCCNFTKETAKLGLGTGRHRRGNLVSGRGGPGEKNVKNVVSKNISYLIS